MCVFATLHIGFVTAAVRYDVNQLQPTLIFSVNVENPIFYERNITIHTSSSECFCHCAPCVIYFPPPLFGNYLLMDCNKPSGFLMFTP